MESPSVVHTPEPIKPSQSVVGEAESPTGRAGVAKARSGHLRSANYDLRE